MNKPSRATFRARLELMVHQLKEDILSGRLPSGSYLPAEVELGEQFQLSKQSVRKGLEVLVNEGLIIKKAKVGNMVNYTPSNEKKIVVRFGFYYGIDEELHIIKLIEEFERKYPHIHVKPFTMFNYSYEEQALEFMLDGILDVVMLNQQHFNYFQDQNKVNILAEQDVDAQIYPFLHKPFTVKDKLFLKSLSFSPIVLCYNKKHFKDNNLQIPDSSWTWDSLLSAAETLTIKEGDTQRYGFFFSILSANRWPLFLLQQGFKLKRDRYGKFNLREDKAFIKGIEMFKHFVSSEYSASAFFDQSDDPERLFVDERVSMILTTYFRLNYMRHTQFEYDISPVPYVEQPKTLMVNIGLGVNNYSNNKEASQLLVDYLTSTEAQKLMRNLSSSIPSIKSVAELSDATKKYEPDRYQLFKEIMPSFHYYTDMQFDQYISMMSHYLKLYLSGLESAENVVVMIEDELNNSNLKKYAVPN